MSIQGSCGCPGCSSGQCRPRGGPPPEVKAAVFQALGRPPQSRQEAKAVIHQLRASGQLPPKGMGGGQGCPCCQQGGGYPGGMSSGGGFGSSASASASASSGGFGGGMPQFAGMPGGFGGGPFG